MDFTKGWWGAWPRLGSTREKNKLKTIQDIVHSARALASQFNLPKDSFGHPHVIANGGSFGGWHSFVLAAMFPKDFGAYVMDSPIYDLEKCIKSEVLWHIAEEVGFERDAKGRMKWGEDQYDKYLRIVDTPKHLGKNERPSSSFIFVGENDTRVMPTQAVEGFLAFQKAFPEDKELHHLIIYSETGHAMSNSGMDIYRFFNKTFGLVPE